ncbi:MAG: hypothetical protein NTV88_04230 [Candidatus Micrarchaeota archaeon]|nr:hypothetical protein [Candidatus Micrarchaeota archaeon]
MVSPYKLIGYALQIAGMAVMMFAFLTLVGGLQKTMSGLSSSFYEQAGMTSPSAPKCDPKTNELCGIDVSKEGAIESVFSKKVYEFIFYLGAGIVLLFMGLLMRSSEGVGGFFSSMPERQKAKERIRIQVGKPGWGGQF